jgi:mannonate dehydratase
MATPRIRAVCAIPTAPQGRRFTIVKITTDQDGLYGYGCATFTQRADLVVAAIERYLAPFLIGKPADRIEDLWQACFHSSYWRNGPVLNNAISGIDMALWDIKGRQAGLPVYQLLGGKCREAVACYDRATGADIPEVIDQARRRVAEGFQHVRLQVAIPGMAGYGAPAAGDRPRSLHEGPVFEPAACARHSLRMIDEVRGQLGPEVELLHDVHERLSLPQALQFCKDVEPYRLFFLEDVVAPEDIAWLRRIRAQSSTPIAMGELFNSPHEWTPLISGRLIDYMRMHVSQMGGLTPARKVAALGEIFGVRTAWHGPTDLSPIGQACNVALSIACTNFGIQEFVPFDDCSREVFSNCPVMKDGYLYPNELPGWGIEVDEKAAARYPFGTLEDGDLGRYNGGWGEVRRADGTIIRQ